MKFGTTPLAWTGVTMTCWAADGFDDGVGLKRQAFQLVKQLPFGHLKKPRKITMSTTGRSLNYSKLTQIHINRPSIRTVRVKTYHYQLFSSRSFPFKASSNHHFQGIFPFFPLKKQSFRWGLSFPLSYDALQGQGFARRHGTTGAGGPVGFSWQVYDRSMESMVYGSELWIYNNIIYVYIYNNLYIYILYV